jgi:SET and MYND domain-containing protein
VSNVTFALVEMIEMRNNLLISENQWISVLQLKSHAKEMKLKDPKRYEEAEITAERVLIYLGYPLDYSKDFVTQLACAVLTNSLTLVAPTCDPIGLVFDPFACLANHSCHPNAYVIMDGPEFSFRALEDITKDQEILVSYVDSTEAFNIRQAQLAKRYYFVCNCSKCVLGSTLSHDVFLTPSPETQRTFKCYMDGVQQETPDAVSMVKQRFGLDVATMTYSDIVDCYARNDLMLANEFESPGLRDMVAKDPVTRAEMLRRVLGQCQMSGQYAVTRQPYAAARNEYILENIAQGEFAIAWLHAVKSYVEIDPILYPEAHNPLRIVHSFRLAKLSIFLASEPPEKNRKIIDQCVEVGLDMPALAWKCMKETAQQSDASHGPESPFTKMVKATFRTALEETQATYPNAVVEIESRAAHLEPALRKIASSLPF